MRKLGSVLAAALLVAASGCGSDSGGSTKTDASNSHADGGATPGLDSGTSPGIDGPVTPIIDAPIGDAPIGGLDVPSVDAAPAIDGSKIDAGAQPVLDGGKGIDGGATPVVDGGAGTCVLPSCMSNGAQTCAPSGTCVSQTVAPTTNTCYENHVKVVQQGALTDPNGMTVTFKNDAGTCFALAVDVTSAMGWLTGQTLVIPVKDAAGAQAGTLSVDPATLQTSVTCKGAAPVALAQSCVGPLLSFIPGTSGNSCTAGTCAP
jgi:hypothetical protein